MKFGIDISRWQGSNFSIKNAIKNHNIDFAILKIGGGDNGLYKDIQFDNYYKQCEENNLPIGCYFFGRAVTVEQAEKEANYFLTLLKDKQFEYPVFYDVEAKMLNSNKKLLTQIVDKFCSIVEKNGYFVGIYASESTFTNRMDESVLKKYTHWVAAWRKNPPKINWGLWQFGGETNVIQSNKINGITVDQNYCNDIDFPSIIKSLKLNNFNEIKFIKKTNDELAREVIKGLWGNGQDRKDRLKNAGYDYTAIQSIVNKILKG